MTHNLKVGARLARDLGARVTRGRLGGARPGIPDRLGPGEAGVFEVEGEQTAAYRDDEGQLHAVSAVCTHLRCTVQWNDTGRSCDCPCHGSRLACSGQVLHGPATQPLRQVPLRE